MPFFSLDLLPLTHFRALKHPIPAMREHFSIRSVILTCAALEDVSGDDGIRGNRAASFSAATMLVAVHENMYC